MSTFQKQSITATAARELLDAAARAAHAEGVAASIAVCDGDGVQKAFLRMDGAPLLTVQIATDKAYTAAGFGVPTHGWHGMLQGDPAAELGAVGAIDRLVIIAGGLPVFVDGGIVAGLGVSGGTADQDRQVAEAALAELTG